MIYRDTLGMMHRYSCTLCRPISTHYTHVDGVHIVVFLQLVAGQKRESEAVKLISIKAGLLDVSQSWSSLSSKINTLSKAQKVGTTVAMSTNCGYYGNVISS